MNITKSHKRNIQIIIISLGIIFVVLVAYYRFDNKAFGELVFSKNLRNHGIIYTMNPDGSGSTNLTNVSASLEDPYLIWIRLKLLNYKQLPPLFNLSSDLDAQWSPDGSLLAYQSNSGSTSSIYLLRANHRNKQRLTHNIDVFNFAWLNRNQILFTATNHQVYLLDTKSAHISAIQCLNNGFMDVSPDGSQVVAVNNPSAEFPGAFTQLVIVDLDCSKITVIAEHPPGICTASWSPTGDEIIFVNWNKVNTGTYNGTPLESYICNQIYRINTDGSDQVRLDTNDYSHKYYLTWSPDGTRIAFTANENDIGDMYVMNRNGSDLIQLTILTSPLAYVEYPVWSPSGDKLAFGYFDYRINRSGIFIYDFDDSKLNSIAINQYGGGSISWRP